MPLLCQRGMMLGVTWDEKDLCPSWPQALLSPSTRTLDAGFERWAVARLPWRPLKQIRRQRAKTREARTT